jgi:hypothetical protein
VSPRLRRWLVGEVAEQRVRIGERGGEDLFRYGEELRDAWVSDAVVDAGTGAAAFEDALLAQCGEVLGGAAGVEVELRLEVADGSLAVAEEFEHADADRMAEYPEELSLDDIDGVRTDVDSAGFCRRRGWGCD